METEKTSSRNPSTVSPSERIRRYLLEEFGSAKSNQGARLPAIRTLAHQLKVSTATVFHVYKNLSKEGHIVSEVGRGTFWDFKPPSEGSAHDLRIALSYQCSSNLAPWANELHIAIMEAASRSERRISLVPMSADCADPHVFYTTLLEECEKVDAMLFLPRTDLPNDLLEELIAVYHSKQRPFICILPNKITATSDFISPNYYLAGQTLGRAFGQCGRKRVVQMMGSENPQLPVSAQLTMSGLQSGVSLTGPAKVPVSILWTEDATEAAAARATEDLLMKPRKDLPDAIVCDGDYQAIGLIKTLRKAGIRVPEDISVVGGTGLDFSNSEWAALTRCRQPFRELGAEAIRMIIEGRDAGSPRMPGKYLPISVLAGSTTTSEENRELHPPSEV